MVASLWNFSARQINLILKRTGVMYSETPDNRTINI